MMSLTRKTHHSSPLHTRMSNNLQAHAHKLAPAPICTIFLGSIIISNCSQQDLSLQMRAELPHDNTMLLYSPVAGAVARLALLVTVSPSTLSSFTWFLFISFSSFFLLRVLSLLTWGAPLLVSCWPPRGPGGPWSDSILGHVEAWPVFNGRGNVLFSPRRKDSPGSECCHFKVTDSFSDLWWPSRPRPISVSLGVLCTKQRKSKDCTEDKIFNLKVNQ